MSFFLHSFSQSSFFRRCWAFSIQFFFCRSFCEYVKTKEVQKRCTWWQQERTNNFMLTHLARFVILHESEKKSFEPNTCVNSSVAYFCFWIMIAKLSGDFSCGASSLTPSQTLQYHVRTGAECITKACQSTLNVLCYCVQCNHMARRRQIWETISEFKSNRASDQISILEHHNFEWSKLS